MRYHLIMNPAAAGGRTGKAGETLRESVSRVLGSGGISQTQYRGHATELARDALRQGAEMILVAGGDGTVNEVVNGMFENGEPIVPSPCLGLISLGTGGDFARTFDMATSVEASLERIARGGSRCIDLGKVIPLEGEPRYFANISSAGLSAEIGVKASRKSLLKKVHGDLAFNWAILTTAVGHQRFPLLVRTSSNPDGQLWDSNCVAVSNGRYFGSGICVAPDADPADGLLEVVIVHDQSVLGFLNGVQKVKKDESFRPEGMTAFRETWVEITCNHPDRTVPIEADGEFAGNLPARFEIVPRAVMLY